MSSVAAMPLHDPAGLLGPHLIAAMPQLGAAFTTVYFGLTEVTWRHYRTRFPHLLSSPFCRFRMLPDDLAIGRQFKSIYALAAQSSSPDQIVHLCFPDRVAFALLSQHSAAFMQDMLASPDLAAPTIYQRTPAAWATHPRNYYEIESFITTVGAYLLDRSLDFAWCHLALPAGRLTAILPVLQAEDMSIETEVVLALLAEVQTKDVDWLAWEDPFLLAADHAQFKAQREASPDEVRKRLSYAIPMLARLAQASRGSHSDL